MGMKDFGILLIGEELKKNKVFIISMPKSATTSTSLFIEKYGYKTMHWIGQEIDKENVPSDAKEFYINFAQNYDCVSDGPYHTLFEELDHRYPESKFIFINRDIDEWALSQMKFSKSLGFSGKLPRYPHVIVEDKYFLGKRINYDFESLKDNYKYHKNNVLNYFNDRADFLYLELIDNKKEKKICDFLGLNYDSSIVFPISNVARN